MEISKVDFTKKLLSIIFAKDYEITNDGLVQQLIKGNPDMLDFETIINHKRGGELQMTLKFHNEAYVSRLGKVTEVKGYFKYLRSGSLCHCRTIRSGGYPFSGGYVREEGTFYGNIKSIKIHFPKNSIEAAKLLLKKIHPNLWASMKAELQAYIDGTSEEPYILRNNGARLKYKNIKSVIAYSKEHEMKRIKQAIEATSATTNNDKEEYSWKQYANNSRGRDFSMSVRNGNAWFASEYSGCLNGDYWLLINPTTAVFYEHD